MVNLTLITATVIPRPNPSPALPLPGGVRAASPADAVSMRVFTVCKSDDLMTTARLTTIPTMIPPRLFRVPPMSAVDLNLALTTVTVTPRPNLSPALLLPGRVQAATPQMQS